MPLFSLVLLCSTVSVLITSLCSQPGALWSVYFGRPSIKSSWISFSSQTLPRAVSASSPTRKPDLFMNSFLSKPLNLGNI
ncbi:uncharacterized protein EV420DRAFT_1202740 [Desarmillaria tabescens]|uniref:Secreted protein n=1 Tax=Armillaria tabescens TaxID=1929756 RepID=A0AA39JAA2_ARMTA|nr:uncharacterized protein EV420DRAFT_1202740 [Desarmillaria tabescens]KAK0439075.1 hypothetical protein EV420DRAFT_1202740 [Desarmillaria tabescens]